MSYIKGIAMKTDYYIHQFMEDKREYPSEFSKRVTQKFEDNCKVRLTQNEINSIDGMEKSLKSALNKEDDFELER